jgi:hypothetical protein
MIVERVAAAAKSSKEGDDSGSLVMAVYPLQQIAVCTLRKLRWRLRDVDEGCLASPLTLRHGEVRKRYLFQHNEYPEEFALISVTIHLTLEFMITVKEGVQNIPSQ